MAGLSRRRFLLLGILSILGAVLGAFWGKLERLFGPGASEIPVPENQEFTGEARPGTLRPTQNREDSPAGEGEKENNAAKAESGENGENGRGEQEPQDSQDLREPGDPEQRWKRTLGKTGFAVSIFGLGGGGIFHLADRKDEVIQIIHRALDLGVNFIDTAPTYGDGISERQIGEALEGRRSEVFLATKTLDRTYDGTMRLVEQSLKNLRTDKLDLYQIHGVRDREEAESIFSGGGVLEAMEQLKGEGVIGHIGITGHRNPEPLRYALDRFEFDCALFPLNPAEVHFQSFQEGLLPLAEEKNAGIIAMKVPAYGRLLRQGGVESMKQALNYVYTLPVDTAIVGVSSISQLEENVEIAKSFSPYSPEEMKNLEDLARPYQEEANFFKVEW